MGLDQLMATRNHHSDHAIVLTDCMALSFQFRCKKRAAKDDDVTNGFVKNKMKATMQRFVVSSQVES